MDLATLMNVEAWVAQTFGLVRLGDRRREHRLLSLAQAMVHAPAASLPKQVHKHWASLKAAYRFFAMPEVTFEALSQPHWQQTRESVQQQEGPVLMIHDTTELDFGYESATTGLGPVGNHTHTGLFLQSVLAVRAADRRLLGIATQEPFVRTPAPKKASGKKETSRERKTRERESEVWLRGLRAVGAPAPGKRLIHVGDSYADMWSFFQQAQLLGADILVRAYQDRLVSVGEPASPVGATSTPARLMQQARSVPACGCRSIEVRSEHERKARQAKMQISYLPMELPPTDSNGHRVKDGHGITVWVVRCWEVDPPLKSEGQRPRKQPVKHRRKQHLVDEEHVEALEWILITTVPITSEQQAWEAVRWYTMRWVVEEYHHGLKTGCAIERRRLGTEQRLESLLGVLAPMALRLLQLRDLMRWQPQEPALNWFSAEEQLVIAHQAQCDITKWTVEQAMREIASWGGFLGRKSDGQPGWKSLWDGWSRLQVLVEGVRMGQQR